MSCACVPCPALPCYIPSDWPCRSSVPLPPSHALVAIPYRFPVIDQSNFHAPKPNRPSPNVPHSGTWEGKTCMYVWGGRQNIELFCIMNYERASQSNHGIPIPCPCLYATAAARLTHLSGVTGFENCLFLLLRMLTHLAQLLNVLILVGILQPSSVKTRLNAQWRMEGCRVAGWGKNAKSELR